MLDNVVLEVGWDRDLEEFADVLPDECARLEQHGCPRPAHRPMPKLIDRTGGAPTYDESFWRKRPD